MKETTLHYRESLDEATKHFDPVHKPDLHALYLTRAARLHQLSTDHESESYLQLVANVVQTQANLVASMGSSTEHVHNISVDGHLDAISIAHQGEWCRYLDLLLTHLKNTSPESLQPHLASLTSMSQEKRVEAGVLLAQGNFDQVAPAIAPFIWAALSLEVALTARTIESPLGTGHEHHNCPVCGGLPVASLIHTGTRQGLRYLHCSLCESEWHMVRAKCTNCDHSEKLDYFSFETTDAAVRAESCGDCHSYLKVISHVQDPAAEVVADDIATLALDAAVTAQGYGRTGLNPFALPSADS
ncbi:formate dehydrogenase accessory protein FdhE [Oligella ureolytica]|nr:formate dehydrogenase accessory protein FdhE [Alcaligenaceae bacterium]